MKQKRLLLTTLLGLGLTLVVLTVFVISPAWADGNTYYVNAATGDDSRTATQAQNPATPWKTISHAAATVPAGADIASSNVISVAAGTYNLALGETFPIDFSNANIKVTGASSATTIIDPSGDASIRDTLDIMTASITIEGFTLKTDTSSSGAPHAIGINDYGGVVINDNTIVSQAAEGQAVEAFIYVNTDSSPFTMQPITITNNVITSPVASTNGGIKFNVDVYGSSTDVTLGAISVLSNTFSNIGQGVQMNEFTLNNLDNADITVEGFNINGNTFSGGAKGIYCESYNDPVGFLDDTTVTFGNVEVKNNTFANQSDRSIEMNGCFEFEEFTNSSATVGDVIVSGNTISNPAGSGISLFVYDPNDWAGASTGDFGDQIISDNTITVAGRGIRVDPLQPGSIEGTAVITAGKTFVENNTIDSSGSSGVVSWIGPSYLTGDAVVRIDTTIIQSNTIVADGTYDDQGGIILNHGFGHNMADNASTSGGGVVMAANQITATSQGIGVYVESPGYENTNSAVVAVDPITITGNTITANDHDGIFISYDEVADTMSGDAQLLMAPLTIVSNTIVNEGVDVGEESNGIYIDYESVAENMSGNAQLVMAPLTIEDNNISSADDDAIEIYYYDEYVGDDMSGNTYAKLPDHIVRNNVLNAGASDDYGLYWNSDGNPYYIYESATIDLGDFTATDNTITGQTGLNGIYYYLYGVCGDSCADTSSVRVGDVNVTGNTIAGFDAADDYYYGGIGIERDNIGWSNYDDYALFDSAVITIGNTLVSSNVITGGGSGVYAYFDVSSTGNSAIDTGKVEILDNTVTDATYTGISLEYEAYPDFATSQSYSNTVVSGNRIDGYFYDDDEGENYGGIYLYYYQGAPDDYDDLSLSFGDLSVISNTITSTDGAGVYYYIDQFGYDLDYNAIATMGAVEILSNTIDSYYEGIYVEYDDTAEDLYDQARVLMGNHTYAGNDITAADDGIYIYYYAEYVGEDMNGDSYARLPDTTIVNNTIRPADGYDGISVDNQDNPYSMYDNARIDYGDFTATDNTLIGDDSGYGIYYYTYEFCYDTCEGNSSAIIGDVTVTNNHIEGFVEDGIEIYHDELGYELSETAAITVGNTLVSSNVITTADRGTEVYVYAYSYDDTNLSIGNVEISDNTVSDLAGDGIYLQYNIYPYDSSTHSLGTAVIKNNMVSDCGDDGIYAEAYLDDPAAAPMSPIQVVTNTVTDCDYGIWVDYMTPGALVSSNKMLDSTDTGLSADMDSSDTINVISNTITSSSLQNTIGIYMYGGQMNLADTNPVNHATSVYNEGGVITTTTALAADYDIEQDDGVFMAENNTLTIGADLVLDGGKFYAPTGLVPTGYFTHTGGTYYQTKTVNGSSDVGFPKAGGLILNANSSDLGSTDVAITAGAQCSAATNSVAHCYVITPTNTTGRDAIGTFYYNASEVPTGQSCPTVEVYDWSGGTWTDWQTTDSRQCGSSPYSITASGIDEFSPFAIRSAPALEIHKTVLPTNAKPGDAITYTLIFSNTGGPASSVVITDIVVSSLTNINVSSSGVTITDTNAVPGYVWQVGDFARDASGVITLTATLTESLAAGVFTNTAKIAGLETDSDTTNNTSAIGVTVEGISDIYLPLIVKNYRPLPDLVMTDLQVAGQSITVTLHNQGDTTAVNDFWVDVYFNPDHEPILNDRWDRIGSDAGAVWGVTANIGAGDSLTLTVGDDYYWPSESSNTFPDGATVYGYVDSINYNTTYGNVEESNEANNLWPTSGSAGVQAAGGGGSSTAGLPAR